MLKEYEAGRDVNGICREYGVFRAMFIAERKNRRRIIGSGSGMDRREIMMSLLTTAS